MGRRHCCFFRGLDNATIVSFISLGTRGYDFNYTFFVVLLLSKGGVSILVKGHLWQIMTKYDSSIVEIWLHNDKICKFLADFRAFSSLFFFAEHLPFQIYRKKLVLIFRRFLTLDCEIGIWTKKCRVLCLK